MNVFSNRSAIGAQNYSSLLRLFLVFLLIAALPVFIWAVLTQRIELRKRAATSEPTQICWNRVLEGSGGTYQWPNSCKGNPRTDVACTQIRIALSASEIKSYKAWIEAGKPSIPGCKTLIPTPTSVPPPGCFYQQVQCVQAPCNPVLICPDPPPTNPTCIPRPACMDAPPGQPRCLPDMPTQGSFCPPKITPTPVTCIPLPRCYFPPSGQPRCTLNAAIKYCSPKNIFTLTVSGVQPIAANNPPMPLSISVLEFDRTPGTPEEGFNVQVSVFALPILASSTVSSANATYNTFRNVWETTVPALGPGSYRIHVAAYCSRDDSICAQRYGIGRQIEKDIDIASVLPTSTPTPSPTPTPTPIVSQTMQVRVKLAGVDSAQAEGATIHVKFYTRDGTIQQLSAPLSLTHAGNGVYQASAVLTNPFPPGTAFAIAIKGEKHIAVRFCRQFGQTAPCADGEYITVPNPIPPTYGFDLTGMVLPPGDTSPQDGRADQSDIDRIKNLMTKPTSSLTAADKLAGDLNYDGAVNGFDLFLILQTLRTRYDEF